MTPAARIAAAIDIFAAIQSQRRPAADALTDWGRSHRFAGSKDRAAIAALVYDALRKRASSAWLMGKDTARAVMLGSLREAGGLDAAVIAALCTGESFAPAPLCEDERRRLESATLVDAPPHVAGNFPEWLSPHLHAAFGGALLEEAGALAERAPVDLRVNALKTTRDAALKSLAPLGAAPTPLSPLGLRIAVRPNGRAPALGAERAFIKGEVELQDEGSQLAALLAGAKPGEQVLDLCAGAGGKTLALSAQMENRGQIYATDADGRRLALLFKRLERAGGRNVQIRTPRSGLEPIADLAGRCHLVLVDAPCTGTGTWRRNPDAKWRIRPGALEQRIRDQTEILLRAAPFVKPGGRLVFVTCSVLREESEERIAAFLAAHPNFLSLPAEDMCAQAGLALPHLASPHGPGLLLSPARSGTDGFYVCALRHAG